MALTRNVYQALEDIVGAENASEEPVILDGYTFNWFAEIFAEPQPRKWSPVRPEAVVLPGCTEEVQAIVKICNRYNVKYKAHSTGYFATGALMVESGIAIDLRRMNRILEIDEKNKYAVVEPYISWAQLTAEILKKGLFTTPIQAGSQASVLASITSGFGMNIMGTHGGYNARNVLGVEWVLPTGEVLKLGSTEEWFCADGPGPSLRGIMRGDTGALGGLGIFTKAAIKLHNWPGPPKLETVRAPSPISSVWPYMLKEPFKRFATYMVGFPNWDRVSDFMYKAGDAEIPYVLWKLPIGIEALPLVVGRVPGLEGLKDMVPTEIPGWYHPLSIILFANSQEEFEYQQKVLDDIIAETDGVIPPLMGDEGLKIIGELSIKEVADMFLALFMVANDTHVIYLLAPGGFAINAGYGGTIDVVTRHQGPRGEELKKKYQEKGTIVNDCVDGLYINTFDGGSAYTYQEVEFHYDPANIESTVGGARAILREEFETKREKKLGIECSNIAYLGHAAPVTGEERELMRVEGVSHLRERIRRLNEDVGLRYGDFHIWQEKIRETFDPNGVMDSTTYSVPFSVQK